MGIDSSNLEFVQIQEGNLKGWVRRDDIIADPLHIDLRGLYVVVDKQVWVYEKLEDIDQLPTPAVPISSLSRWQCVHIVEVRWHRHKVSKTRLCGRIIYPIKGWVPLYGLHTAGW